jgi:hypothetical protein
MATVEESEEMFGTLKKKKWHQSFKLSLHTGVPAEFVNQCLLK